MLVSVAERVWLLWSCFWPEREQITRALDALLRSKQLVVGQADRVVRALRVFRTGHADFADCPIERGAAAAGYVRTMTFDGAASKTAGLTLI